VRRLDAAPAQDLVLVLAEVVADRADDVHGVEERGGQGKVHRRPSQHPLPGPKWGLDRVKGDRSDNRDCHGARRLEGWVATSGPASPAPAPPADRTAAPGPP